MKKFAVLLSRIVLKLFYRVELIHTERIPAEGPALLCANHNGMLDMFFIGYKIKRWIYWMAKEELFRNPISAFIYRHLGAFPVKRGKGDVGSIKTAFKILQEGKIVGIFPHGTRVTAANKSAARIKPGVAMIAINSKVPILPVAVKGNNKIFSHIRIIFGEPFIVDAESDRKYTNEELSKISGDIMNKVYSLLED